MVAIQVENLTKTFDGLVAVDHISFSIRSGEIFGLLGPNGAGKTTTLSMLSTILPPTSGSASINGYDIAKDQNSVRRTIGIVFQDPSLDDELTAYENMDFHGRLYRVPGSVRPGRIEALLRLVELQDRKDDFVKTFSGGMKRRLEIARGLLHEPKVLFLDEPTLGLDPQTRNRLWAYILQLNSGNGITIILTTHYMDEADRLCNTVGIIDRGKIIAMDTPGNLKDGIGGDMIIVGCTDNEQLQALLAPLPWVKQVQMRDGGLAVQLEQAETRVAEIVRIADNGGLAVNTIAIHKPTLEDVFLHFTGRRIREEDASARDQMRLRRKLWRR